MVKTKSNFTKRFGNVPRITLGFSDKKDNGESRYIAEKIFNTYCEALAGILKRQPAEAEIFGDVNLGDLK